MIKHRGIRLSLLNLEYSSRSIDKIIFKSSLFCWSLIKFLFHSRYRAEQLTNILYRKKIIQVSTYTRENRYPLLFDGISEKLKGIDNPKILSFGCSTGEEVFSLKELIPNAEIIGIDINHWCISQARKRNKFKDCYFFTSKYSIWRNPNYYDCILALAVFQNSKNRFSARSKGTSSFTFESFNQNILNIHEYVKGKGLLVIDHSDYCFECLDIFKSKYIAESGYSLIRDRPTFDFENKKIAAKTISHRIYRKMVSS